MNQRELQGKYARLRGELDSPAVYGERGKAWRTRLVREVDQVDLQLAALGRPAQPITMSASQTASR